MKHRTRLTSSALAAAIALGAAACEGGERGSGTRPNEAEPANESPTMVRETPSGPSFLDPLTTEQERNLFEVEADHGQYWRMLALDRFDGETWTSTDSAGSHGGVPLSIPATLPQSGGSLPPGAETLNQTFRVLSDFDSVHTLPMAQTAEEIAGPIGDIIWDPARSQALIDGDLEAGMEYTVRSWIVVPTPEELDRVDHLAPRAYGRWTQLPADLDPRFERMAERWTADATSDYRKVLAIQQHFHRGGFVYSTDIETSDDADDLLEFLTQTRAGFCQQYTAAMVVMVRALGLPARIAVGYRSGTRQKDGSHLVHTTDAHVWVEVLFPRFGWLQFEPETGTTHPNAQPGNYLSPLGP